MKDHLYWMRKALQLAQQAARMGEVPVGAVLVCGDTLIAADHNRTEALQDPTAHAEMLCLTAATSYLRSKYLRECTLYVTLEPCPMCAGALAWAQIGTLVYGAPDPERGFSQFHPPLLLPKTHIHAGLLANEALALLKQFFQDRRI
jgi:tRNA(adenine34) deaminase